MTPQATGQLVEMAEYGVGLGAAVYIWLIGRGSITPPGRWRPGERARWWLRAAGLLGMACGVLLLGAAAARLVGLMVEPAAAPPPSQPSRP